MTSFFAHFKLGSVMCVICRRKCDFTLPGSSRKCDFRIPSFVRSSRKIFLAARKFFDDAKISEKKVWVDASDSVQESSKSELSSRFFGRLKILATCPKSIKITIADSDLRKSLSAFDSMKRRGVSRKQVFGCYSKC